VPPCRGMGAQCRQLRVTLRIGSLDEGSTSLDHEATWLLGHTEHLTFGDLWHGDGDLYVDATLHVPCRHLTVERGVARCAAHGFAGSSRRDRARPAQPRRLGGDRFRVVDAMQTATRVLPVPPVPRRLPVLGGDNPCATAPCRTSDHRRGAACCRDLQIEIMCTRRERRLEALVRARRSPYLCKVTRPGDFSIEAEMISACGYLAEDGIACSLHGRVRADGRPAKPDLCSDWPPKGKGPHPGCVFAPGGRRRG
ncbi:MAG: hypothetical protein ACREOF_18560, partial [Gemmatimonadales bacterium]